MNKKLTHLNERGAARMVDVSAKEATEREATAEATVILSATAFDAVVSGETTKGDVFAASRIAGIMAAKKTSELIPLCHQIALTGVEVEFTTDDSRHSIRILASAKTSGKTGVEMEALTAASVAALTIYDMTKSVDKGSTIDEVRLLSKSGGKSGTYVAKESTRRGFANVPPNVPSRNRPSTLMNETSGFSAKQAADAQRDTGAQREAFRTFMTSNHLRATQWAKDAGVPVAQIYAFLTGKTRSIPADIAQRLARAARSQVDDMFR
jgi:cyclic pyranopterin phosphate synthase